MSCTFTFTKRACSKYLGYFRTFYNLTLLTNLIHLHYKNVSVFITVVLLAVIQIHKIKNSTPRRAGPSTFIARCNENKERSKAQATTQYP